MADSVAVRERGESGRERILLSIVPEKNMSVGYTSVLCEKNMSQNLFDGVNSLMLDVEGEK